MTRPQIDMFAEDIDLDYEIRKLRHSTDPETSALAARDLAESGKLGDLQGWVLGLVRESPGMTGSELAEKAGCTESYTVKRRLSDLKRKGLATRGIARPCKVTGKMASTWWAA